MPQILAAALIGAGVYAGYRFARARLSKTDKGVGEAAKTAASAQPRDLGTLEADPATGVYRPRGG